MFNLKAGHADTDLPLSWRGVGTRFRLHRKVKHDLVSGASSGGGGFYGVAKMRKNGERKGIWQSEQSAGDLEVLSEIVNDDGGVEDATDLQELPAGHLLSITRQANVRDSPSCLGPGFVYGTFQAALLSLVLEGDYDRRIDLCADSRF
jgi:hypothetical protein